LNDVITPSLQALVLRIEELSKGTEPWHVFALTDVELVLNETKKAFALSVQSIWERQLRDYLKGCASELHPQKIRLAKEIEAANWRQLCNHFYELREIQLSDFPSYEKLEILQYLGNVCRHGEGTSANELRERCPDLWPLSQPTLFLSEDERGKHLLRQSPQDQRPLYRMEISIKHLRDFVCAIAEFWRDAEYIYNESIISKHPSLEARLVKERAQRQWMPKAPAGREQV
jgi:hypothetical protein